MTGAVSTPASPVVLVVDDDEDIRLLTRLSLESVGGWRVLTASGGAEAIDIARDQRPDVVLLDMMMPDMNGLTTFDHLLADERTQAIPVILFTAKASVDDRQPWEDHPLSGVIAKPYDPMTLADRVAQLLGWTDRRALG